MGGHKPKAIARDHAMWLSQRIKDGDFTIRGLVAGLAGRDPKVDYHSMWDFVHLEKFSLKRVWWLAQRDRPDVARRRDHWTKRQNRVEAERLVDETWTRTDRAPLRGWAPRGTDSAQSSSRLLDMTFLAALRHDRIDAPWFIEGRSMASVSGSMSRSFSHRRFVPKILSSWTISAATKANPCASSSAPPEPSCSFLPKYSPDLNPIEQVFAKPKHLLRKAAAQTLDAVCAAIGELLDVFTPEECANYLINSGSKLLPSHFNSLV